MKWAPLILCLLSAAVMIAVGSVALAVHKAHSFSTYRGWEKYGIINENALEKYNEALPPQSRRDLLEQLRQVGNVRYYLRLLSGLGALLLLVNAALCYAVFHRPENRKMPSG
jgi:hypothetical protein